MPLGVILRDVLDLAHNLREAKRMLATRQVLVDGRIETDLGRGVGLMDVLTVGEDRREPANNTSKEPQILAQHAARKNRLNIKLT
jgi:ribosomal protein S4E